MDDDKEDNGALVAAGGGTYYCTHRMDLENGGSMAAFDDGLLPPHKEEVVGDMMMMVVFLILASVVAAAAAGKETVLLAAAEHFGNNLRSWEEHCYILKRGSQKEEVLDDHSSMAFVVGAAVDNTHGCVEGGWRGKDNVDDDDNSWDLILAWLKKTKRTKKKTDLMWVASAFASVVSVYLPMRFCYCYAVHIEGLDVVKFPAVAVCFVLKILSD